jgi:hypothetical protein
MPCSQTCLEWFSRSPHTKGAKQASSYRHCERGYRFKILGLICRHQGWRRGVSRHCAKSKIDLFRQRFTVCLMNFQSGFFERDPVTCAREMIGCELIWNGCGGVVVETEAYSVLNDEACHTFTRPSSREFVNRMPPGTVYGQFEKC